MDNYCVIEIKNSRQIVTGFTASVETLIDELESIYEESVVKIYGLTVEEVKNGVDFHDGLYFLINGNNIDYVKKTTVIDEGYIPYFNTTTPNIDYICSWELVESTIKKLHNNLFLEQFSLEHVKDTKFINIIGKTEVGKTTLVYNIISHHCSNNMLIVSNDENDKQFYTNKFPEATVLRDYDDNILGSYLNDKKGVIVIDNCLNHGDLWLKKKNLVELFKNNKKYNKTVIVTMQFPLVLTEEIRLKFDTVFLFKEPSFIRRKRLYQCYGKQFIGQKVFEDSFTSLYNYDNYECLVLNKDKKKNIYHYQAKKVVTGINNLSNKCNILELKYKIE